MQDPDVTYPDDKKEQTKRKQYNTKKRKALQSSSSHTSQTCVFFLLLLHHLLFVGIYRYIYLLFPVGVRRELPAPNGLSSLKLSHRLFSYNFSSLNSSLVLALSSIDFLFSRSLLKAVRSINSRNSISPASSTVIVGRICDGRKSALLASLTTLSL